jgi:hypothetical protein
MNRQDLVNAARRLKHRKVVDVILTNSQPQALDFTVSQLRGHSKTLLAACESTLASIRHTSRLNAEELNRDEFELLSITSSTVLHSIRTFLGSLSSLQYLNDISGGYQDPLEIYIEERLCIDTEIQSLHNRITDLTNQLNLILSEKDKIVRENNELRLDLHLLKQRTVGRRDFDGSNELVSKWTTKIFHKTLEVTIR